MIKNKLYAGMDAENFEGVVLDVESIHDMDVRSRDAEELEQEIASDLAVSEEASQTVVEIQEEVATLAENVENMNPVAIGKAIGSIEDKLDTVAENVEEVVADEEALMAGDLHQGVRNELEAISDKLKSAWEAVKKFFKQVWIKIQQIFKNILLWVADSHKKAKDIAEKLGKKGDMKADLDASKVASSVGTRLAMYSFLFGSPLAGLQANLKSMAGNATSVGSKSTVDVAASKVVSGSDSRKLNAVPNITSDHTIKVTRIDGNKLHFGLAVKVGGELAYDSYVRTSLNPAALRAIAESTGKEIVSGGIKLADCTAALSAVEQMAKDLDTAKKVLYAEMNEIGGIVNSSIENVKFKQGIFKMIWSKTLGTKSADQLTAEDNVKLVKNRLTFTNAAVNDILFGGFSLIKDINGFATIVGGCYKDAE